MMIKKKATRALIRFICTLQIGLLLPGLSDAKEINNLKTIFLPPQVHVISTIPENGDLNPYGVAFVPEGFPEGAIKPGDILVSNFNDNQNLQGKGSTIVSISENDTRSLFFQGSGSPGLTTALNVLKKGFVLVGSFPTSDGSCATATNGSIRVINNQGLQVQKIEDPEFINGPWDSVLVDQEDTGKLFIANALTGTIVRFDFVVGLNGITIFSKTKIASGYKHECDAVTFVNAPTGLVYDSKKDILYVASTMDNKIFALYHASTATNDEGKGVGVFSSKRYLHGPLAMTMAPNGDLIVTNNDVINPDPNHFSALTEFTPRGEFVKEITLDANAGAAFGLNLETVGNKTRFAAVNDNANSLFVWKLLS
ncbi:NHL repeat-containing protein [Legionella saoudiensis]|uniref:hypothetical protein n=1 Tax=Legionella saoudiensis TaxID=1750561 RepID=UPI00072FF094|nr:hypothetical protein [Legionella saoudiensis]